MATELQLPPDADGEDSGDSLLFVGNATVLLRHGGLTILTDPTFVHRHERVDLGYGLSTTRLTDPALDIEDLPPLDLVLLSHFHGDHFDQVAQEGLDRSLPLVTTPHAREQLGDLGFERVLGLDTWETVTVTKAPGASTSRRAPADTGRVSPTSCCPPSTSGSSTSGAPRSSGSW